MLNGHGCPCVSEISENHSAYHKYVFHSAYTMKALDFPLSIVALGVSCRSVLWGLYKGAKGPSQRISKAGSEDGLEKLVAPLRVNGNTSKHRTQN